MIFADHSSNLHPAGCYGPGDCIHCDREISSKHDPNTCALCDDDGRYGTGERDGERTRRQRDEDGPTDEEIYNRVGVEGGIAYDTTADEPGSLGENDWRL